MQSWEKIPTEINITNVVSDINLVVEGGSNIGRLNVILKFSQVRDGFPEDIQVEFRRRGVLAYRYIQESFDYKIQLEGKLPSVGYGHFPDAAYPLLQTENSRWLTEFSDIFEEDRFPRCRHYLFLSLNDVLEVLADESPAVTIVGAVGGK